MGKISTKFHHKDEFLATAVNRLIRKYGCHTVVLYGSRARGDFTAKSDYDLMGVRKGKALRLAKKEKGFYLDIFIYSERELKTPGEQHLYMKEGIVLFEKEKFGTQFLKNLKKIAKRPYRPMPKDEILARRIWAHKMWERTLVGDIEANYRRSWLHEALLSDYFNIRRKRYLGSKKSFAWLEKHDPATYRLFEKVLREPTNLTALKKLVEKVTKIAFKLNSH